MSGKYLIARDAFGTGEVSWTNDTIAARLVRLDYIFREGDSDVAAIEGTAGKAVELTGKEFKDGWARADKMVFKQVPPGPAVVGVVFYRQSDGMLIEFADSIEGFPMTPNGGDIEVEVTEPGIFRI